ncbi:hypothetical protein HPB48_003806 [Haemaphysalis longicornis]|uniref:Uncharacterized protein n=1 Tax=Haemaphysalis longicornis TaxID=44386 RepID=A0A9J6GKL7_HAELO|nr:hypothetical protein HPB48_003806 [Haemaphysalis longicornis]
MYVKNECRIASQGLRDTECSGSSSLRRSLPSAASAAASSGRHGRVGGGGGGRGGDGDWSEQGQWILDPPPSFGGSPPCFSLSYAGHNGCQGGSGGGAPPEGRNDFRSLPPLSVGQERKPPCCPSPGQSARSATHNGPRARPSHLATGPLPPLYVNFPPSPVAASDVPDLVSRPVLATAAATLTQCGGPAGSHALSAGLRRPWRPVCGAPGHWLAAPPASPRRTHSDPVIHLDEEEQVAGNQGIWTYRPRHSQATGKADAPMCSRSRTAVPEELTALQEINAKLWSQVQHLQSQLELMRRLQSPGDKQPPTSSANGVSFAELLADVYYAQRERDDSISERLASANQSLELYHKELQKLAEARSDASDGSSDEDTCDNLVLTGLDKILQGLEGSWAPARVARHQETLLATVHRLRDHRGKRARHRLRAVQAERDVRPRKEPDHPPSPPLLLLLVPVQVKVLEKELQELHMKAIWKSENWPGGGGGCSSADAMQQATNERNAALGRLQELQESLAAQTNGGTSDRVATDGAKISTEAQTDFIGVEECLDLSASPLLQQLREEVQRISQRLDEEIASRQGAESKCQRLEELVNGFQKRLNGLNSGFLQ